MPTYHKTLHPSKGSYLAVIPKSWVEKYGASILMCDDEPTLTITSIPSTKETNPSRKEGIQ
jgi:hypothetical protein